MAKLFLLLNRSVSIGEHALAHKRLIGILGGKVVDITKCHLGKLSVRFVDGARCGRHTIREILYYGVNDQV